MEQNSGHGPTVLRAYREAIATGADFVLQVDGDGQFEVSDIRRLADDIRHSGADIAMGKRCTGATRGSEGPSPSRSGRS